MSAETEQYRDRLGKTAYDAMVQTTGGVFNDGKPWRTHMIRDTEMLDVAAAVAAQVLRDFEAAFTTFYLAAVDNYTAPLTIREAIERFAAERGIDLSEGCDR